MSSKIGNQLDSTGPVNRRGKEKEIPKQRITTLRKNILKEKELKETADNETVSGTVSHENLSKEDKVHQLLISLLHTKNYREYCRQKISVEIIELTTKLLTDLVRFQDRQHQLNPVKAKTKRRLGFGMKEVMKYVELGKVKCVFIAPDIVKLDILDKMTKNLIELCKVHNVVIIFSLGRYKLGKVCKKRGNVSVVAVFNYDGAQDTYRTLLEKCEEASMNYEEVIELVKQKLENTDEPELDSLREEIETHCHIPALYQSYYKQLYDCKVKREHQSETHSKNQNEVTPNPI